MGLFILMSILLKGPANTYPLISMLYTTRLAEQKQSITIQYN